MVRHLSNLHDIRVKCIGSTRYAWLSLRDLTTCHMDWFDRRHLVYTTFALKTSASLVVLAGTWYDGKHSF